MITETSLEEAPAPARNGAKTSAEPSSLPEHEQWLENNPEARASIERGLADLAAGRVHRRRSYAEYADVVLED